ncbi:hypothetical protein Tco_0812209, partial [Tanacetum coccineum]
MVVMGGDENVIGGVGCTGWIEGGEDGIGHRWMFDLDYLTDSMNYIPVSLQNQANPTGSKEVIDIDVQTEEDADLMVVSSTSLYEKIDTASEVNAASIEVNTASKVNTGSIELNTVIEQ